MTDQERIMLIETDQRAKSNSHRLDNAEAEIRDIKNDQKAIYKIATSVEVIAQRLGTIEATVSDTREKVEEQGRALQETDRKLTEKISEVENAPSKQTAHNYNAVKVAIITAACTTVVTSLVAVLISLLK